MGREFTRVCCDRSSSALNSMLDNGYIPTVDDFSFAIYHDMPIEDIIRIASVIDDKEAVYKTLINGKNLQAAQTIMKDVDLTRKLVDGSVYLHFATTIPIAEWLIANGCNINAFNKKRETPLLLITEHGSYDFIKFYLDNGAKQFPDNTRCTPLHNVCNIAEPEYRTEKDEMYICDKIKLLLDYGAVIIANEYGDTPLHYICWAGMAKAAKVLLEGGARQTKNRSGETPLYEACRSGNAELVKILLAYGAKVTRRELESDTRIHMFSGDQDDITKQLMNAIKSYDSLDDDSDVESYSDSDKSYSDSDKSYYDSDDESYSDSDDEN